MVGSTLYAQDAEKGMGMNMPAFADCDLNGDGSITEDEFNKARSERIAKRAKEGRQLKNLANAPSFDDIDVDDNGGIDPDEFAAHQVEHRKKRS
jgi:Ca2+-binding EF-hand superfamily protein